LGFCLKHSQQSHAWRGLVVHEQAFVTYGVEHHVNLLGQSRDYDPSDQRGRQKALFHCLLPSVQPSAKEIDSSPVLFTCRRPPSWLLALVRLKHQAAPQCRGVSPFSETSGCLSGLDVRVTPGGSWWRNHILVSTGVRIWDRGV